MAPTIAIPDTPDDLRDLLADDTKMATVLEEGNFSEFVDKYVAAFHSKNPDHEAELAEARQQGVFQFLRDHGSELGAKRPNLTPGAGNKLGLGEAPPPGAQIDKLFENHSDFIRTAWHRNSSAEAQTAQNKMLDIQSSFGSTIPSSGGFLIPETLRAQLLQVALESAVVRPRATVIPMDTLRVPFPTIDDTSHESSVYGGMIGYWTEEAGALTESEAKFGRVVLEAKKLTGYSEVPNELFMDSINSFGAFLSQTWPRAISFFEDIAFLTGSGVGEPLGMLKGAAAVEVTRATSNQVNLADIADMYARMLPSSLNTAVWLCSPKVIAQLLKLDTGTGGAPLWLSGGQLNGAPTMTLLGRPLIVSEKVSDLGTAGDLAFVDFGYYLLGDRQAMSLETSQHFKFKNDLTAVRIIERADGRPWINSALTPHNGGDPLTPIVKLAA